MQIYFRVWHNSFRGYSNAKKNFEIKRIISHRNVKTKHGYRESDKLEQLEGLHFSLMQLSQFETKQKTIWLYYNNQKHI